uniref:HDC02554 n=1 Tax=Drosophila melanogaster TaxID=7227 RepID=Q6IHH8_DROME|nr:TPA_inf: HDC02554 [Drosophila melanogaster]
MSRHLAKKEVQVDPQLAHSLVAASLQRFCHFIHQPSSSAGGRGGPEEKGHRCTASVHCSLRQPFHVTFCCIIEFLFSSPGSLNQDTILDYPTPGWSPSSSSNGALRNLLSYGIFTPAPGHGSLL